MKKLILFELTLLFLATTFVTDSPPPGWYQQSINIGNRQITDIYFLDSLTGWVVTNGGSSGTDSALCLKTTDGGNNWTEQIRVYGLFNAVQFVDINTGYIAADRGPGFMLKSTNSGVNWFQVFNAGQGLTDLYFVNRDTGWACDDDPAFGVGIIKTTDGGVNWFQQAGVSYKPRKLFFINKDTGWAGSTDWKLYRTTNSGQIWELQYTFSAAPNFFFPTKDTGYYFSLLKTTNGGFNWFPMNNGQGGRGLFFINGKTGWASDLFSIIQKTTDGQNWFNQTTPIYNNSSVYFSDSLHGWAGGSGLVHTTDGGGISAIQQISTEIPADFVLYQNYPNPFNPGTIIRFQIKRLADLKLAVYDLTGKEIVVLANGEYKPGTYEVDFSGEGLSSGVYFYKIIITSATGGGKEVFSETKRMLMIK